MFITKTLKQISFTYGKFQSSLRGFSDVNNATKSMPTALYDFHLKHGGKIVNFAGYVLPLQYTDQCIRSSHLHTRRHASIFDVSHMLQTYMHGKDAISCMESLCTADIKGMTDGTGCLTVFTNSNGGILDDLIVSKVNGQMLYAVSNAAMKAEDMAVIRDGVDRFRADGKDVSIEFLSANDQSLIAVQGPEAVTTLEKLLPKSQMLDTLYFMHTSVMEVAGVSNCRVTRCGYTGEDGVEVSVPSVHVQHVTEALLDTNQNLKMAGLGARDSLRLEAGLCLYGTDINDQITPVEAGLTWLIARSRRNEGNFPGSRRVLAQLQPGTNQVTKRRIGLIMNGQKQIPPARAGVKIYCQDKVVGHITSGCPSPTLGKNIAMGYITNDLKKLGTEVQLKDRFRADGKDVSIEFLSASDQSLIAVQGPEAVTTLEKLLPKSQMLDTLYFMHTSVMEVAGVSNCRVTRCGYTGEDGVEVSVPSVHVQHVTEALLDTNQNLKMAGLGARDSLRLEAGLCLYGTDINDQITPVEAGLTWLIARSRRNEGNFPGSRRVLAQLQPGTNQVTKRRIGLIMNGQKQIPPARAGVKIYCQDKVVGHITSGCPSPTLGKNIAMGYITNDLKKLGTEVQLKVRNVLYEATLARMPFVKSNYYVNPNK